MTTREICKPGFRPGRVARVSAGSDKDVLSQYALKPKPRSYGKTLQIDLIIPAELGGAPVAANLFPERADAHPGYKAKDRLEKRLKELVCAGKMKLRVARRRIAADWIGLYRAVFGELPSNALVLPVDRRLPKPREQVRYVAEVSRDANERTFGGTFTNWHETLELRLPATHDVQALRIRRIGGRDYQHALRSILASTGLFAAPQSLHAPPEHIGMPKITVSKGVLTMIVDVGRRWELSEHKTGLCFSLRRPLMRAELPTVIALQLKGYDVRSVRPFPTTDDGSGNITWAVRGDRPRTVTVCVVRASNDLVTSLRTRAHYWRLLYPPVDFAPLFLVFLVAWWVRRRARRDSAVRGGDPVTMPTVRAVLWAALWLALLLIVAGWVRDAAFVASDKTIGSGASARSMFWHDVYQRLYDSSNALGVTVLVLGVVALASLAAKVTGAERKSPMRRILGFTLLVTAAAIVGMAAADVASDEPIRVTELGHGSAWYHLPLAVAGAGLMVASFILFAALMIAIFVTLAAQTSSLLTEKLLPRRAIAVILAAGIALLLGCQWLFGVKREVSGFGFAHGLFSFEFFYSAMFVLTVALFALPIALLLALMASMRAARDHVTKQFESHRDWVPFAIALIFAAYVVGRAGWIERISIPMPVAFLVAFAAISVLARRKPYHVDSDQVVGVGPGEDWWANGVWAAKLSIPLAIAPFLFYAYTLLDARAGSVFALDPTPDLANVLLWIANEAAFWIVAALVFGWLLAYLPGRNSVLKSLSLAGIYAGSTALGVLLVGRTDEHWLFRASLVVLFYIGTAIRLDLATLKLAGRPWRSLGEEYRLGLMRGALAYAAPALLALIGIIQQVYVGNPAQAGHDLLQNLSAFVPHVGGGGN